MTATAPDTSKLLELTTELLAAYVSNNKVPAPDLPALLLDVYSAYVALNTHEAGTADLMAKPEPAVDPSRSVTADGIICLEDGKKFQSLKRHLQVHHNLTPEEYRKRWDLEPNYPMVASNYAEVRSKIAKGIGLGDKPKPVE